jgi:hypothetical protein
MTSNLELKSFLLQIIQDIDQEQLTPQQQLLLFQYFCKSQSLHLSKTPSRDIWDYLSLGIFLLESDLLQN